MKLGLSRSGLEDSISLGEDIVACLPTKRPPRGSYVRSSSWLECDRKGERDLLKDKGTRFLTDVRRLGDGLLDRVDILGDGLLDEE